LSRLKDALTDFHRNNQKVAGQEKEERFYANAIQQRGFMSAAQLSPMRVAGLPY